MLIIASFNFLGDWLRWIMLFSIFLMIICDWQCLRFDDFLSAFIYVFFKCDVTFGCIASHLTIILMGNSLLLALAIMFSFYNALIFLEEWLKSYHFFVQVDIRQHKFVKFLWFLRVFWSRIPCLFLVDSSHPLIAFVSHFIIFQFYWSGDPFLSLLPSLPSYYRWLIETSCWLQFFWCQSVTDDVFSLAVIFLLILSILASNVASYPTIILTGNSLLLASAILFSFYNTFIFLDDWSKFYCFLLQVCIRAG